MTSNKIPEGSAHSFLDCSSRKDFEFLYDMFSANIYEAVHSIVESEEIAEKVLTNTFVTIRKHQFAYSQNYIEIFTLLLRIAIQLSCDELKDSQPKGMVYQKLGINRRIAEQHTYS